MNNKEIVHSIENVSRDSFYQGNQNKNICHLTERKPQQVGSDYTAEFHIVKCNTRLS